MLPCGMTVARGTALRRRVTRPLVLHLALGLAAVAGLTACSPRGSEPARSAPSEAPPRPTPERAPSGLMRIGELEYVELTTAGAPADAQLPMLVAIHGLGDAPDNFAALVRDLPFPARVILPRAIDDHEPGWSWFPLRARDPDVEGLARGMTRATEVLHRGVQDLVAARPTVGKPVVTGFSQGGMLSFALAAGYGDTFSAAVPVSGWLPPPLWPDASTPSAVPPIFALHGTADPAVKYPPTVTCVEHLRGLGVDAHLETYPDVRHVITRAMRATLHEQLVKALKAQSLSPAPPRP